MPGFSQRTFQQIYQSLQRRARSTDTGTGTFDLLTGIKRAINDALEDLVRQRFWGWTIREFAINTTPPVVSSPSTVINLTAGSTTVSAVGGTPFTSAMVGRFLSVSGGNTPYEITAFGSSTSLTINVGYEGETNVTGASWRILQDTFTSDPRIRKIRRMILYDGTTVYPIGYIPPREWDLLRRDAQENRPIFYTIYKWTSDGVPQLRLYPIPATRYVLRFAAYCFLPELVADGDVLEVPGPVHGVIEDLAHSRVLSDVLRDFSPEAQAIAARAAGAVLNLIREDNVEPDWDARVGDPSYLSRFPQVIAFPPEVGRPTGFYG